MSNLREFSDRLYLFHKEAEYKSIETLITKAKDFYLVELEKVDEKAFARTRLRGPNPAEKKKILLTWMITQIDNINQIVKRKSDNDMTAVADFYNLLFREDGTAIYDNIV